MKELLTLIAITTAAVFGFMYVKDTYFSEGVGVALRTFNANQLNATYSGGEYLTTDASGILSWGTPAGGAAASSTLIEIDGVSVNTGVPTLDFDGTDFSITESPADDFDISVSDNITFAIATATTGFIGALTGNVTGDLTGDVTGNADTATALAANGANCSAGNSPLGVDASGAVESCFDVWTEAENTSAAYISGNETITLSGDISGSGATAITTTIGANAVEESMLKAVNAAVDEDILTYESTTGDFEWHTPSEIITAGNALTFTGTTLDFDGGASPGGELGGTWASPTIDDSLAVTGWNLTTPTFTTNFTFDGVTVTGLSGADVSVITGTAGTSGNCVEWNADGDIVDAGAACGTGGGSGSLSTTTDIIGVGAAGEVAYYLNDFILGGSSSTTAPIQFDVDGAQIIIASTSAATSTISDASGNKAIRLIESLGEGIELYLGTAGDVVIDGISSVAEIVTDLALTISGTLTATGVVDFSAASLEIPNGTNPTTDAAGEIALDTTDNQLIVDDGTNDMIYRGEDVIFKVTIASTSDAFVSGGIVPIPPEKDGFSLTKYRCYVSGGTSVVLNVSDGTNATETITCGTTLTSDDDVATNDTFTAGELAELQFGTITGTVNYVTFTAYGYWARE